MMEVRKATYSDIDELMDLFADAKKIMRASGNLRQWSDAYPSRDIIYNDISNGNCFVLCEEGSIIATMALISGPDHTYARIDGRWPDDDPYHVIHRIAASAPGRNTAGILLDWAFGHIASVSEQVPVIRIDTHRDNCIMKHILEKYGFTMCGVIYLDDGSPRDAYICRYPCK